MARPSDNSRRAWLKAAALAATEGSVRRSLAAASDRTGAREELLKSLLNRNHRMNPEYGGGLANHCSMGLLSLAALGGTSQQLSRFADSEWVLLDPLGGPTGPEVTANNWIELLGRRDALSGFLGLFRREVTERGHEDALRRYLPRLLPGLGAGAFHGLIRTAYGVRFRNDDEVADGLAYWAIAHLPLGELPPPGREAEPLAVLEAIHRSPALSGQRLSGDLIFGKMKAAAALPAFPAAVAALKPEARSLERLAAAVIRLYVATGDFTALHAVTATHAYRQLLPFLPRPPDDFRYLWQAVAAAYVTIKAPAVTPPTGPDAPPWHVITNRAAASRDPHDLKLVEIARDEESCYHDPIYRLAAARRMHLDGR
jgi:hypothetical protein